MNAAAEQTCSLWMAQSPIGAAPQLSGDRRCDSVIVGAGIAGLSVAHELATSGQKVIVLDRGQLCGGMTSRTTAHLSDVCDDGVSSLISLRGEDAACLFRRSQAAAIDRIETLAAELNIDCDFRRLDGLLFPKRGMKPGEARDRLDEEYEAFRKVGGQIERVKAVPLNGFEAAPALRFPGQATFQPLHYLSGLIESIRRREGLIFADSAVVQIDDLQGRIRVHTEEGSVEAANAVFATNSPINDRVALHSKMGPYRTYAIALTLPRGSLPDALYWDLDEPYHYVRLSRGTGSMDYLIAGGADHKSGEADDGEARFDAIEAWLRELVPQSGRMIHRWSGQVLETIDYCGFIGRNPGSDRIYVVTGDSGQGMTHGALAGILVRDLILTGQSPWSDLYDPGRIPIAAAANYVSENVTAIKSFAEYLLPGEVENVDELKPGQGGIVRSRAHKIAASRDLDGKLHLRSAVCTHLGCHLHWNSTEQCWDCPCHGSHFAPNGAVLSGPAINPLQEVELSRPRRELNRKA